MKKKLLMAIMAAVVMGTTVTPTIMATVDETQEVEANSSAATEVKYSQGSTFSVIVPKTITLDSETKASTYTVKVTGDIASNQNVSVVPEETVTMEDVNGIKADVVGTITQDKKAWLYDEMATVGNGNISATDLTAGTWNGTFSFAIALNTAQ